MHECMWYEHYFPYESIALEYVMEKKVEKCHFRNVNTRRFHCISCQLLYILTGSNHSNENESIDVFVTLPIPFK